MAQKAETAVFGSDRGGVGKSKAAELRISRHLLTHGTLPTIIEVEADPRLSLIYGPDNVKLFRIAQNRLTDFERDPSLIHRMWDLIGQVCMDSKTDVVLDIGANLTRTFALWLHEYGEDGPFGAGAPLTFFGLTTGDRLALESVHQALGYIARVTPASKRYLVINERDLQFPVASDAAPVQSMVKWHGLRGVLRMPACLSPGLAQVVNRHMRLDEAAKKPVEWWEEACGYSRLEAVRARRRMIEFLDDGTRLFDGAYGPMSDSIVA
jgi:hypothetical protein